jgi:hypothetical protein
MCGRVDVSYWSGRFCSSACRKDYEGELADRAKDERKERGRAAPSREAEGQQTGGQR